MSLPNHIDNACDEIDAALFTGDTFHDRKCIQELESYMARWQRGLENAKEIVAELGLQGSVGECIFESVHHDSRDENFSDLASMNDHGVPWPEIAAIIRDNPDNFFTKSV